MLFLSFISLSFCSLIVFFNVGIPQGALFFLFISFFVLTHGIFYTDYIYIWIMPYIPISSIPLEIHFSWQDSHFFGSGQSYLLGNLALVGQSYSLDNLHWRYTKASTNKASLLKPLLEQSFTKWSFTLYDVSINCCGPLVPIIKACDSTRSKFWPHRVILVRKYLLTKIYINVNRYTWVWTLDLDHDQTHDWTISR